MAAATVLAVLAAVCVPAAAVAEGGGAERREVSLDARALVVDGTRRMLFAGEMHYTRSTPEVSTCTPWLWEITFGFGYYSLIVASSIMMARFFWKKRTKNGLLSFLRN